MKATDYENVAPLVRLAQGGDSEAFAVLVEWHSPAVSAIVRRRIPGRQDREDIVQGIWLEAWKCIGGMRPEAFGRWIRVIARRACYKVFRQAAEDKSNWRNPEHLGVYTEQWLDGRCLVPEEHAIARERMGYVVAAIRHLPEQHSRALQGYYFMGLSYKEMADEFGGMHAVKRAIDNARAAFIECYTVCRARGIR